MKREPLYIWLLRLRHVHPSAWQRAALGEGSVGLAAILVLADVASAWVLVALPVTVALVVKANDVLAGLINPATPGETEGAGDTVDDEAVETGRVETASRVVASGD